MFCKGSLYGYAYEIVESEIKTYLVFKKNKVKFILDNIYKYNSNEQKDNILNKLISNNYRTTDYWESKFKTNNCKRLVKKFGWR